MPKYLTTGINEFQVTHEELSPEDQQNAIPLETIKCSIYNNNDDYQKAFGDKIFVYKGMYYRCSFNKKIKVRYISESVVLLGLFTILEAPPIKDMSLRVKFQNFENLVYHKI